MTIKTFRGILVYDSIIKLRLKTISGSMGYKIIKFDTIKANPGAGSDVEGVIKIYTVPQTTVDGEVDLSDQTLVAVNYNKMGNVVVDNDDRTILIDGVTVNQDLYVTYADITGNQNSMNYLIELEQSKLRDAENEYVTLKDLKQVMPQHGVNPPA